MKRTLPFIAFALITLFVFTGCYSNKQPLYVNSMSATIDTIPFSASGLDQVSFWADTSTHKPQVVDINAKTTIYTPGTAVQPTIKLIIPISDGTYQLPSQATAIVVTSASGSTGTMAVSGQIVVLRYAYGRIQGNFSFTCADGTVVKNGQFIGGVGFP